MIVWQAVGGGEVFKAKAWQRCVVAGARFRGQEFALTQALALALRHYAVDAATSNSNAIMNSLFIASSGTRSSR